MTVTDPTAPALLGDTLAALLGAVAEAERQLAASTIAFIDEIGFRREKDAEGNEHRVVEMVDYQYQKLDENRQPAWFKLSIPLLGMVNVPMVGIRSAVFSFSYEVTGHVPAGEEGAGAGATSAVPPTLGPPAGTTSVPGTRGPAPVTIGSRPPVAGTATASAPSAPVSPGAPSATRAPVTGFAALSTRPSRLVGRIARPSAAPGAAATAPSSPSSAVSAVPAGGATHAPAPASSQATIEIKIELDRVPMPVGVSRLFDMLELAAGESRQGKPPGSTGS